ncbi:MAG: hypothetical protein WBC44_15260 [Planctomycetaceae bacterium]
MSTFGTLSSSLLAFLATLGGQSSAIDRLSTIDSDRRGVALPGFMTHRLTRAARQTVACVLKEYSTHRQADACRSPTTVSPRTSICRTLRWLPFNSVVHLGGGYRAMAGASWQ